MVDVSIGAIAGLDLWHWELGQFLVSTGESTARVECC